jgi:type IV fimbrial biogenesis protein FimT
MNAPPRSPSGFTLLELLTALAVLALAAALALPALGQMRARAGVSGAANEFETLLHQGRAHAWATGEAVHLAFEQEESGACLLVHTGERGGCRCNVASAPASCQGGARLLEQAHWPAASGVVISANVASMRLDAGRGTVTPAGTVRVASPLGPVLHQVVNVMGRVRTCVPALAPGWPGVAPC